MVATLKSGLVAACLVLVALSVQASGHRKLMGGNAALLHQLNHADIGQLGFVNGAHIGQGNTGGILQIGGVNAGVLLQGNTGTVAQAGLVNAAAITQSNNGAIVQGPRVIGPIGKRKLLSGGNSATIIQSDQATTVNNGVFQFSSSNNAFSLNGNGGAVTQVKYSTGGGITQGDITTITQFGKK